MSNRKYFHILGAVIVFVLVALAIALPAAPVVRAQATDTPTPTVTNTPTPTYTPTTTTFPVNRVRLNSSLLCIRADFDCVQGRGGAGIHLYATDNTNTFYANGATGDLMVTGIITGGSLSLGGTPYATATPALLYGNTPAAVKEVCKTVNITGSSTVIAPGITTPRAVTYGMAADPVGNYNLVTHTNAAGVVTVKVWGLVAETPVANTTPVAVDVCIKGN